MNFNPTVALWMADASEPGPSAVELRPLGAGKAATRPKRRRWLAPRLRLRLA